MKNVAMACPAFSKFQFLTCFHCLCVSLRIAPPPPPPPPHPRPVLSVLFSWWIYWGRDTICFPLLSDTESLLFPERLVYCTASLNKLSNTLVMRRDINGCSECGLAQRFALCRVHVITPLAGLTIRTSTTEALDLRQAQRCRPVIPLAQRVTRAKCV